MMYNSKIESQAHDLLESLVEPGDTVDLSFLARHFSETFHAPFEFDRNGYGSPFIGDDEFDPEGAWVSYSSACGRYLGFVPRSCTLV